MQYMYFTKPFHGGSQWSKFGATYLPVLQVKRVWFWSLNLLLKRSCVVFVCILTANGLKRKAEYPTKIGGVIGQDTQGLIVLDLAKTLQNRLKLKR